MKVKDIKSKVAAKVAKGKAKVAKKCGKCALVAFALLAVVGCQHPAQRAQTAETTQNFYMYEGSTGNFTFGSEFVSLAQSNETGGNDAGLVATQTPTVSPKTDVNVGGAKSGTGMLENAAGKLLGDDCPNGECVYTP